MKPKNGNYKLLYQQNKKRKQKQKKTQFKSESEINQDSLDLLDMKTKISRLSTNNYQQIDQDNLKQLRTCISNQFKKTNFINFSVLKNKIDKPHYFDKQYTKQNKIDNNGKYKQQQGLTKQKDIQIKIKKRKLITAHNRSQSCPFIQPVYFHQNLQTKDTKVNDTGIVFSSVKIQKQQKKKISIQHLTKNRHKFNAGGSAQKKNIQHNYSNSLTQSSNTVIVHNIPNQINQYIIPNQHLSSILYEKSQDNQQAKTQKDNNKNNVVLKTNAIENGYIQKKKVQQNKSGVSGKTLVKKQQTKSSKSGVFYLKTKISQQIINYELKQQKNKIEKQIKQIKMKQDVLEKLLQPLKKLIITEKH